MGSVCSHPLCYPEQWGPSTAAPDYGFVRCVRPEEWPQGVLWGKSTPGQEMELREPGWRVLMLPCGLGPCFGKVPSLFYFQYVVCLDMKWDSDVMLTSPPKKWFWFCRQKAFYTTDVLDIFLGNPNQTMKFHFFPVASLNLLCFAQQEFSLLPI